MNRTAQPIERNAKALRCAAAGSALGRRAFSLVEIMVAVGLLSVIIVGLMAMFYQTQRAFRLGVGQVDVMESGRRVMEGIGPELQETVASDRSNVVNLVFQLNPETRPSEQTLPGAASEFRTNMLFDLYFLRRQNDEWIGTAYRVSSSPVGSLYKLEQSARKDQLSEIDSLFVSKLNEGTDISLKDDPPFHRLIDGVVHFRLTPYDRVGVPLWTNMPPNEVIQLDRQFFLFRQDALPAYVEVELGILEGPVYATYLARPDPLKAAYLQEQAGKVHLFRKRIPIRAAQ